MNANSKKHFGISSDNSLSIFAIFWLFACFLGCVLSNLLKIPIGDTLKSEIFFLRLEKWSADTILEANFWHYIFLSVKWDITFLFLLHLLIWLCAGKITIIFAFFMRGFLFGVFGFGLLSSLAKFEFIPLFFFLFIIRNVLLTAIYLCYTELSLSEFGFPIAEILKSRSRVHRVLTLVTTIGLSLVIQILYTFLIKIDY